jgi:Fic family protein
MAKKAKPASSRHLTDHDEPVTMMLPAVLSDEAKGKAKLNDLALELVARSAGLKRSLPEGTLTALAELVRIMNSYYSNLIEGHNTHPMAIERAMRKNYDNDPKKRNLQKEAEAHVAVQRWIDSGALDGALLPSQASAKSIEGSAQLYPMNCCGRKFQTRMNVNA